MLTLNLNEDVTKEWMKAFGFPDDKISSQSYEYQKEGYNWLITGSPALA